MQTQGLQMWEGVFQSHMSGHTHALNIPVDTHMHSQVIITY